ncbi:MAG: hypothetical protein RKH07_12515, partial [Gammaproteobacteria bacterium]
MNTVAGMEIKTNKHLDIAPYMARPYWWMNEQDRVAMNVEKAERWGWEPEYFTLDASMSPLAFFSGASSKKILV